MDDTAGHTLQAIDVTLGEPIVSLRLADADAQQIMRELWPDVDFGEGPGGGSISVRTEREAEVINDVLGPTHIVFRPERHRWMFHAHLVDPDE